MGLGNIKNGNVADANDIVEAFAFIDKQQLEQNINILINSAAALSILEPYDEMFLDIFNVAAGNDGTVDTGSTTSSFEGDKYVNSLEVEDFLNGGFDQSSSTVVRSGWEILVNTDGIVPIVKKSPTCTSTKCYLTNSTGTIIETVSFIGDVATFTTSLSVSTTYNIVTGSDGSNYTRHFKATHVAVPVAGVNVDFTDAVTLSNATGSGTISLPASGSNLISIISSGVPSDTIVQTNAITVTADPNAHQLFCHNNVAGSGSVTYDISFDGGSTFDVNQPLNTKNATIKTGSSMIIKLNLNGTGSGNTSESKDYATMLYYE